MQSEKVYAELQAAYRRELRACVDIAIHPECREPRLVIRPWRQAGEQFVCELWVADAAIPWQASVNFHGQNTSQWRYGGAIVVEGEEVSTHH